MRSSSSRSRTYGSSSRNDLAPRISLGPGCLLCRRSTYSSGTVTMPIVIATIKRCPPRMTAG
jgi:hypothetical protein